MIDLACLQRRAAPFPHWVGDSFLGSEDVRRINAAWPAADDPRWRVEGGATVARKASMLFPQMLPAEAHGIAVVLYSPWICDALSALVGLPLLPDPWFEYGPDVPRLGGGLHEIHAGGMLGVHIDFERHPSGLRRVANLLIYLNEDWRREWGGALELHGDEVRAIQPRAGRAVLFRTTADSWHGHPEPLRCPAGRARRSLALYYYAADDGPDQRPTTVYRRNV
jgi:hypothetical protein